VLSLRTTPICCGAAAIALTISLGAAPKPTKLLPEPAQLLPAEPAWLVTLDAPPSAPAAMDDVRIYVPLQNGGLHAFDRETGVRVFDVEAETTWPPVADGTSVYVAEAGTIRALDARGGGERWAAPLQGSLAAPMMLHAALLVAGTDAGTIIGVRVLDGSVAWRQSPGANVAHRPAPLGTDAFVVTLADNRVMALDLATGQRRWERSLPGTLSAPATGSDRVFVGSTNNFFYALDAERGDDKWHWRTGGDVVGAAVDGDRVYFVSLDNILRAVKRSNGNQQWKKEVPTRPSGPPVAFGDIVVISGVSPRVDGWVGKTGVALGSYESDADLQGAPLIDTTVEPFKVGLVTLTRDGKLTALRPTKMMLPDPPLAPLLKLPGRELPREKFPG
jgi:outer membrane protein assembly factor BamB